MQKKKSQDNNLWDMEWSCSNLLHLINFMFPILTIPLCTMPIPSLGPLTKISQSGSQSHRFIPSLLLLSLPGLVSKVRSPWHHTPPSTVFHL